MKSGKCVLGLKQSLKTLRQGKSKLVIIANNTSPLRWDWEVGKTPVSYGFYLQFSIFGVYLWSSLKLNHDFLFFLYYWFIECLSSIGGWNLKKKVNQVKSITYIIMFEKTYLIVFFFSEYQRLSTMPCCPRLMFSNTPETTLN